MSPLVHPRPGGPALAKAYRGRYSQRPISARRGWVLLPAGVVIVLLLGHSLRMRGLALGIPIFEILALGILPLFRLIRRFARARVSDLLLVARVHIRLLPLIRAVERPGIPLHDGDRVVRLVSPPHRAARGERRDGRDESQCVDRAVGAHGPSRARGIPARAPR